MVGSFAGLTIETGGLPDIGAKLTMSPRVLKQQMKRSMMEYNRSIHNGTEIMKSNSPLDYSTISSSYKPVQVQ